MDWGKNFRKKIWKKKGTPEAEKKSVRKSLRK